MQYMLLIYSTERDFATMTEAQLGEVLNAYNAYTAGLKASGCYIAGDALKPTQTATTVRVRGGKALSTDGPFAETKEQLGGYYLLECKTLDEAIHHASKCPGALDGSIEVRPVMDYPKG